MGAPPPAASSGEGSSATGDGASTGAWEGTPAEIALRAFSASCASIASASAVISAGGSAVIEIPRSASVSSNSRMILPPSSSITTPEPSGPVKRSRMVPFCVPSSGSVIVTRCPTLGIPIRLSSRSVPFSACAWAIIALPSAMSPVSSGLSMSACVGVEAASTARSMLPGAGARVSFGLRRSRRPEPSTSSTPPRIAPPANAPRAKSSSADCPTWTFSL